MRSWQRILAAVSVLLLISTPSYAGKIPLTPERLLAESQLIVVGKVQSHRDDEQERADGSKVKQVFLTVQVESVEKVEVGVKPGEAIQALCWVIVKPRRDGIVWDSGHGGIPGDGGRAKFFLENQAGAAWRVIYPNGIERLDETPVLHYPMETPKSFGWAVGLGIAGLVVIALLVWVGVQRNRVIEAR